MILQKDTLAIRVDAIGWDSKPYRVRLASRGLNLAFVRVATIFQVSPRKAWKIAKVCLLLKACEYDVYE